MKKEIILGIVPVEYLLNIRTRSRSFKLVIHPDATITVSAPLRATTEIIEQFILSKSTWVLKHLAKISTNPKTILSKDTKTDFIMYKEQALLLVQKRLEHFNTFYNLNWNSVSIRNQKTRWGSCSKRRALNFSYKVLLLDPELCDYIVVHELCHLQEFNHSPRFWNLVSKTIPNYDLLRKKIRQIQ